jgi:hypothetical protein
VTSVECTISREVAMQVWQEYQRISRLLAFSVKMRVGLAVPLYLKRARILQDPTSLCTAALDVLRPYFSYATPQQLDVLAFYLLGAIVASQSESGQHGTKPSRRDITSIEGDLRDWLDSRNDLSEVESLRLQMTMVHDSKLIFILSNLAKTTVFTRDGIIQNLK